MGVNACSQQLCRGGLAPKPCINLTPCGIISLPPLTAAVEESLVVSDSRNERTTQDGSRTASPYLYGARYTRPHWRMLP